MKISNNQIPSVPNSPADVKSQKPARDPKILQAARMYEQVFLSEMVKAMRNSVQKSDLIQENMAEKIFTDQLYDNYVEQWSDSGGVGLADIVYDQMIEKFGIIDNKTPNKPTVPVRPRPQSQVHKVEPTKNQKIELQKLKSPQQTLLFKIKMDGLNDLISPWSGKISGSTRLSDSTQALFINHDNGLKSTLVFDGVLPDFKVNQTIPENLKLGTLASNAPNIIWKIDKS